MDQQAITPLRYRKHYIDMKRVYDGIPGTVSKTDVDSAMCMYVRSKLAADSVSLQEVVHTYMAWRSLYPATRELGDDPTDCEDKERWMINTCCKRWRAPSPFSSGPYVAKRIQAMCQVNVVTHMILYHDIDIHIIRWMCEQAGMPSLFPMFQFKLNALVNVHAVEEMDEDDELVHLVTDRDMSALKLFAHDLLAQCERAGILVIDDDKEGAEIESIARRVFGQGRGIECLDYEYLLGTPYFNPSAETGSMSKAFTPRSMYVWVMAYGRNFIPPLLPKRKEKVSSATCEQEKTMTIDVAHALIALSTS